MKEVVRVKARLKLVRLARQNELVLKPRIVTGDDVLKQKR